MITVENLSLRAGTFGLNAVSFEVPTGQHAILMGRTGSGKTSILEAICGLRPVEAGSIRLNGRDVTGCAPALRGIGFVPQDGALFPHLTVREHLTFAMSIRGWDQDRMNKRVQDMAGWLRLDRLLDRKPFALSGGEAQRAALGRALSFQPEILCLDEPLSALDEETREEIRDVLQAVRNHSRVTILHVTHSLADAHKLADCVLRLRDGVVGIDEGCVELARATTLGLIQGPASDQ